MAQAGARVSPRHDPQPVPVKDRRSGAKPVFVEAAAFW